MTATPAVSRPTLPLRLRERTIVVGARTVVMGIVNCTPDSFYEASRVPHAEQAAARYRAAVAEGADWVDVGGESTRPGAEPVAAEEEWRRIAPVIEAAQQAGHPVPLSVDTTKASVARRALAGGAVIVNDISALRADPAMGPLVAETGAALVCMHMQGTPRTMQADPRYGDVVAEVRAELAAALARARDCGIAAEQVLIDPGIGFGKTAAHNLEILRRLGEFSLLERPILIGCSRKRFIGAVLDLPAGDRLEGTLAAHILAAAQGAHAVRVHDVAAHTRALRLADAIHCPGDSSGAG
jgi:dihydropteroate synthase